jgi:hypothetical protein
MRAQQLRAFATFQPPSLVKLRPLQKGRLMVIDSRKLVGILSIACFMALSGSLGLAFAQESASRDISMEALVKDGYEIKAMQRGTERSNGFVVLLQRGTEVRSCLMRIERAQNRAPTRKTVCF